MIMDVSHINDFPKDLHCAACHKPLRSSTTMAGDGVFKKGLVIVCSFCSRINIMSDSDLRLLTRAEFDKLDAGLKINLYAAIRAIQETNGQVSKN